AEETRRAEAVRQAEEEKRRADAARGIKEKTPAVAAAPSSAQITPPHQRDEDLPDLAVSRDAPFAPELVVIPAGEFWMGSADEEEGGYKGERPRHSVTIGQRFAIGRYPVTFEEYVHFCVAEQRKKPDDRGWGRKRRPVIDVNWQDAQDYIAWLSHK